VALPPIGEQHLILQFLGHEVAKIDVLIAEQQRLIELLKEKRRAVVSHAITKGLNAAALMRESGIEWLGKVPEHWNLRPLKYLARFKSGGTPDKSRQEFWDGNVPWASAKDLKVEVLDDTEDHITDAALDAGAASLVPSGSLLVVVRGMILARMFPVVRANVAMAINQDLKAVIPTEGMSAKYLAWLFRGSEAAILSYLDEAAHGTKALRMDTWGSMLLPVPPLNEQVEIVTYVERTCASLFQLMEAAERGISLLQERRRALISAAVTGKIDIRGFVGVRPEEVAAE
jgi:type I restriction enzyme S subunit